MGKERGAIALNGRKTVNMNGPIWIYKEIQIWIEIKKPKTLFKSILHQELYYKTKKVTLMTQKMLLELRGPVYQIDSKSQLKVTDKWYPYWFEKNEGLMKNNRVRSEIFL